MLEQKEADYLTDTTAPLPFKGVIFDMDGTLIVSTEADYLAWKKVFNHYGKKLNYEDYQPLLGIRSANVIKEYIGITSEEDVKRILKEKFDYFVEIITANPIQPVTAGLTSEKAERLDLCLDYYYYQSEVIRYLEVAKLVGATISGLEPEINLLDQDEQETRAFRSVLNKPYIILHPVAVDIRRMWPVENYSILADELKKRNFEVVFTGAQEDKNVIDAILEKMNNTAINACGSFSLGGLASLLSYASLMIAADTGPLHLARAVNIPTIGFYWAPNLINWGPLTRTIHRPLVSWNMACPICGVVPNDPYPFEPHTESCDHPVSFVRDISVNQVLEAVESLINIDKVNSKNTVVAEGT